MAEQKSSSSPVAPLRAAASAVRRVPGAEALSRAGEGILDKVESVSPRRRRLVVYAGAGVLGVVGVVEWPIALTGAAVAWLTQAGGGQPEGTPPAAGPGTARTAGTSRTAGTARAAGTGTARAAKAPAAASKRASTGRRTSASAPASTPASARKKTAPAARRGTTAKSGTSTRTAKKGTSTRTTAKQGRTTR
ncbi:hypothetical protein [Streptomyces shenzhenensis]|uniref:hypothetical protein n=1 Tax=Streptomyces shenzhenensis TaxID=943815 RepID=UPI0036C2C727